MIAWIDRGILSNNRLVLAVSVVLRNFDVPELENCFFSFLFLRKKLVRRKLCANSFVSFTVQEIYGNTYFFF